MLHVEVTHITCTHVLLTTDNHTAISVFNIWREGSPSVGLEEQNQKYNQEHKFQSIYHMLHHSVVISFCGYVFAEL